MGHPTPPLTPTTYGSRLHSHTPKSTRRTRPILLLTILVLTIIYILTGSRRTVDSPFYTRTVKAMREQEYNNHVQSHAVHGATKYTGEIDPHSINEQGGTEEVVEGVGGAGGEILADTASDKTSSSRKKSTDNDKSRQIILNDASDDEETGKKEKGRKPAYTSTGDDGVARIGNTGKEVKEQAIKAVKSAVNEVKQEKPPVEDVNVDHEAEALLDEILKKSPIIIFSKTYCRFSKKAKHILLDLYAITPAPYVVELDQHDLGSRLQSSLQKMTKRSTVPNILVNGKSLGGGDDVEALHNAETLIKRIEEMGGKRIMEMKKVNK